MSVNRDNLHFTIQHWEINNTQTPAMITRNRPRKILEDTAYDGLMGNNRTIKSWQAISVLHGIILIIVMPDSPMRTNHFTEEEKHLMVERVRSDRTILQYQTFRTY
ncbi:hypothetical protein TSTA_031340 [Talaromyces stipitatus ATCC 10500]|uniref:Uncharacterized protein n=1 Tax=Talaromyces stipitatus (strain ATCC 10500 / CBS 375.48 / QM 6759 / NRRL 1006) TaxID=441959 RepID=B8M5I0_TALSN|nr:uncharacterized protein TSTA_031340 [Talaromyces stipitatus ATCC 10500]EED19874.1 hypothetical protein TSTA_031340 [Talaromyces stipitatus ATCC 10500]